MRNRLLVLPKKKNFFLFGARNTGKSTDNIRDDHIKHLTNLKKELGKNVEAICLADVPQKLKYGSISVYPWSEGIIHYFAPSVAIKNFTHNNLFNNFGDRLLR